MNRSARDEGGRMTDWPQHVSQMKPGDYLEGRVQEPDKDKRNATVEYTVKQMNTFCAEGVRLKTTSTWEPAPGELYFRLLAEEVPLLERARVAIRAAVGVISALEYAGEIHYSEVTVSECCKECGGESEHESGCEVKAALDKLNSVDAALEKAIESEQ